MGELELSLKGVSAAVEPARLIVPKNIASGARIRVRAGADELSPGDLSRFLGVGFEVQAELSGPGLGGVVSLPRREPGEAAPADPLLLALPPLPMAGEYALRHITALWADDRRRVEDYLNRRYHLFVR